MERHTLPKVPRRAVVGLFGGSFDPPHLGHVAASEAALTRFGLDRVWWLVSPGNPLKARGPAALARRVEAARAMIRHPRIEVTDIEARIGTRYTAETLAEIGRLYPDVRFVWLMGADNLAQFDRWRAWRDIMETVPVGVIARPGDRISARMSKAAAIYRRSRLRGRRARLLGQATAPAWSFINIPLVDLSSTDLRAAGRWTVGPG